MIDFRYHIVSIVSIFLALAVGIVLGAGPLQGRLGDTLSKEVSGLRKTKSDLNTQLTATKKDVTNLNNFAKGLAPELVTGRLTGRSVVLVRLPGSTDDVVKTITDELGDAGAKVNGTVKVTKAWTDPTKKDFRDGLAKSLAPLAGTDLPTGAAQDPGLADVLARGLVVTDISAADKNDSGATTALQGLKTGGLIDYSDKGPQLSTLAVVVAGPPTPGESDQVQRDEATSYAVVARALDARSAGAVAVSDQTATNSGGALEALRSDKQASAAVSTVDDVDQPIGLITLVMAIREQLTGKAGQYGVGVGADSVVPDLTTP
jgi:Copper transport outer membrane protein, MctB